MTQIIIATARLDLRELNENDAGFILGLLNQPSFLKFVGDKGVRTLEGARGYIREGPMASYAEHGFGLYLVSRRDDSCAIGMCGLLRRPTLDDPDIGFGFIPESWSHGFATEASRAVLARARNVHGLERVVAITAINNASSKRVLEKIGLRFEELIRLSDDADEICLFGTPEVESWPVG